MPFLGPEERDLLNLGRPREWPCSWCHAPTLKGYCRQCDEFYSYGCRCANAHAGHRTYEEVSEMLPRPSSKPREEILALARVAVRDHGGPDLARVFFKYDCAGCDRRVTIAEPDTLPRRARCLACGAWTEIAGAGYMLQFRYGGATPWAYGAAYFRKQYLLMPEATVSTEWEA